MNRKKILLAEPVIESKTTISLLKKVLTKNFPNEGKLTRFFEKKLSKLLKVKYVSTTTSGTTSIFLALKALDIKENDEVIIPNITFPATANAVKLAGAKPILADVNKTSLLLCENSLLKKINKRTKAIIPVHVSGRGSNIKKILKIAKTKKLYVIEDAAEAFMSKNGRKYLGTFGDVGCFSFAPNKIITTGQGGIVATNNKLIYKKILILKDQGRIHSKTGGDDIYKMVGYNFKYTNLQTALGLSQLKTLKKRMNILKNIYKFYNNNLSQSEEFKLIGFDLKKGELPLWTDVFCKKRNKLFNFLKKRGINCRYFWRPLNTCHPYKKSFSELENSKSLNEKLMWLPSSLRLTKKDLIKICSNINNFYLRKNL